MKEREGERDWGVDWRNIRNHRFKWFRWFVDEDEANKRISWNVELEITNSKCFQFTVEKEKYEHRVCRISNDNKNIFEWEKPVSNLFEWMDK